MWVQRNIPVPHVLPIRAFKYFREGVSLSVVDSLRTAITNFTLRNLRDFVGIRRNVGRVLGMALHGKGDRLGRFENTW